MNGKNRIPRRDTARSGRVWKNQQWQQDDPRDQEDQDRDRQPDSPNPPASPQEAASRLPKRDYDHDYDYDYDDQDEHQWNREGANVGNPKIYSDQNPTYGGGGGNYNRQKGGGGGGYGNQGYQRRSSYQPRQQQFEGRQSRGGDRANDRGGDRSYDRGNDRGSERGYERSNDRSYDRGGDRGYDRGGDRGGQGRDSAPYEARHSRSDYRQRDDHAGGRDRDGGYQERGSEPRPRRMIKRRPPGPAQPTHRGGHGGPGGDQGGHRGGGDRGYDRGGQSGQPFHRRDSYQQDRGQDRRGGGDHQPRHHARDGEPQARHQNQRFQKPRKPQITRKEAQKNFQKKRRNLQIVSLPRAMAKLQFGSRNITIDFIRNSRVSVNNTIVSDPNKRVILFKDRVAVDYMPLKANRAGNFVVLHKPAGLVPSKEPNVRTVHSLVPNSEHWYFPAGRLSKPMSGLVITTNHEDHRNSEETEFNLLEKEYHIKVNRIPKRTEITALNKALRALHEDNGKESKATIHQKNKRSCWLSVTVKRGGVSDINKVLKNSDLEVLSMHRYRIGTLTTDTIKEGAWKQMNEIELAEILGHDTSEASYFYQRPSNADADEDEHGGEEEDMDDIMDDDIDEDMDDDMDS